MFYFSANMFCFLMTIEMSWKSAFSCPAATIKNKNKALNLKDIVGCVLNG